MRLPASRRPATEPSASCTAVVATCRPIVPFQTLSEWLDWQQGLHPEKIVLGLDRVRAVWSRLGPACLPCPVLTIGGTNGKGSCLAMAEAIYRAAGYRTGAYSSPHLLHYTERIRIAGQAVDESALCEAFTRVDEARGDVILTYFEFGTLAALDLFVRAGIDVAILEVGLGGRLDAVNLIDADVALVTTIGRDHMAFLGGDLEAIAMEKAGIFRAARPAVIGQRDPPATLRTHAELLGCRVLQLGSEFDWHRGATPDTWTWIGPHLRQRSLVAPGLRGDFQLDNAAAVLTAASCLEDRLPISVNALRQGLQRVRLAGRFQVWPGRPTWILDVAHNGQAATALAGNLGAWRCRGRLHAVLAVLNDKEPGAIVAPLRDLVDVWHLTETADPRAMHAADLATALADWVDETAMRVSATIAEALRGASSSARDDDAILVLGSFTTVEAALRYLQRSESA